MMSRFFIAAMLVVGVGCWSYAADTGREQDGVKSLTMRLIQLQQKYSPEHPKVKELQKQLDFAKQWQLKQTTASDETQRLLIELRDEVASLRQRIDRIESRDPAKTPTLKVFTGDQNGKTVIAMVNAIHKKYRVKVVAEDNRLMAIQGDPVALEFVGQAIRMFGGLAPTNAERAAGESLSTSNRASSDPRFLRLESESRNAID